jgi:hypothetical protein
MTNVPLTMSKSLDRDMADNRDRLEATAVSLELVSRLYRTHYTRVGSES